MTLTEPQIGLPGVDPDDLKLIQKLMREGLGSLSHGKIFAFGSRVIGSHRANSDLDLWIACTPAPDLETLGTLRRMFEESPLPFAVDLIDESRAPAEIQETIRSLGCDEKILILEI